MKSVKWYKEQVRGLFGKVSPRDMMNHRERLVTTIQPGKMYMFFYDPKLKDKLPFYDTFPLVLPFKGTDDGFLGLNFHYLPYMVRVNLLNNLMTYRSNKRMDDSTKIMVSWKMLQGASTHAAVKPAVKRYLSNHVSSKFLHIHADEWPTAIMLPVESFQGATKQQVWNDSKKKMG